MFLRYLHDTKVDAVIAHVVLSIHWLVIYRTQLFEKKEKKIHSQHSCAKKGQFNSLKTQIVSALQMTTISVIIQNLEYNKSKHKIMSSPPARLTSVREICVHLLPVLPNTVCMSCIPDTVPTTFSLVVVVAAAPLPPGLSVRM